MLLLIVDDDRLIRGLVRATLEDESVEILEAASGADALRIVGARRPDLVLLDVMMPEMDGYEVCRRLRADPEAGDPVVVMLTARDDAGSRTLGMDAGADAYMTKPFSPLELIETVEGALGLDRLV